VSVEQGLAVCLPWNSGALAPRSKDFETGALGTDLHLKSRSLMPSGWSTSLPSSRSLPHHLSRHSLACFRLTTGPRDERSSQIPFQTPAERRRLAIATS
jgi:hypothetical protein